MDGQELYNLHEAYMDVYENQQLDEISQKTATKAYAYGKTDEFEGLDDPRRVERNMRLRDRIKRKFGNEAAKHADRAAHARTFGRKGFGGMPPKPEKTRKEQYDLYDIILSHLLDEGYAETLEAAEVMMVNMSEEWRDSILSEGEKPLPYGRMMKKSNELADSDDKEKRKRAAKIYLAANSPMGPKVKIRK